MFEIDSEDEIKKIISSLKKDLKSVKKGKLRSFFVVPVAVKSSCVYEYITARNRYVMEKMKQEKERAWNFITDEEQAKKYGWYAKKQNPQQLEKWTEQAFPQINFDAWEIEYDIDQLVNHLKEIKG